MLASPVESCEELLMFVHNPSHMSYFLLTCPPECFDVINPIAALGHWSLHRRPKALAIGSPEHVRERWLVLLEDKGTLDGEEWRRLRF